MSMDQLAEKTIPGLHHDLVRYFLDLNLNKDAYILDLGCGTGAWLLRLADMGYTNLYGIDTEIEHNKIDRFRFHKANLDLDDLGLGSQKFDLITAIEVIEHLENPGRLFHHVSNHISKDGFFLLTTPNVHSLDCRLKYLLTGKLKSFDEKGDPTHIYPVLMTSLERILPRYSLQIAKQWGYPSKGSKITRQSLQFVSSLLENILPNPHKGDSLCLLIKRA
jgi:2-polyprenyl-3-methyl-5-hydroxy-6-metoxy-1,4-benzoquinol methylase